MFSNVITFLLHLFDFLGFFTEFQMKSKSNRRRSTILLITHSLMATLVLHLSIHILQEEPFENLLLGVNELIKFFSSLGCYWLTVVETFLKRDVLRNFFQTLNRINEQYCQRSRLQMHCYILKYVEFIIFVTFIRIFLRLHTEANDESKADEISLNFLLFSWAYFIVMQFCMCRVF